MNGDLFNWITNQGFAIAVAGFLLLRLESKIDKLIRIMEELAHAIRSKA